MLRTPVVTRITLCLMSCLFCTPLLAAWNVNMPQGVTAIGQEIYGLHMWIFWVCVGIAVVVFGIMLYSLLMFRHSKGAKAAHFHEHTLVEVIWTVIPAAILIIIGIPATKTLAKLYNDDEAALTVQITGYQWKWQYQYLQDDDDVPVGFFSNLTTPADQIYNLQTKAQQYLLEVDEPLVIPAGQKVRLLLSANDVIHSWWVPDLAVKKDAVPGIMNTAWTQVDQPGTYRGQCTELCGKGHAFMPIVVKVVEPEQFKSWYADKQQAARQLAELTQKDWTFTEMMALGEQVYQKNCAVCHKENGEGIAGVFPALKGSDMALNDITAHINTVVNGVQGTAMSAFGKQLSEVDLAAVITYERNAWGNATGQWIAPIDILNFNQGTWSASQVRQQ